MSGNSSLGVDLMAQMSLKCVQRSQFQSKMSAVKAQMWVTPSQTLCSHIHGRSEHLSQSGCTRHSWSLFMQSTHLYPLRVRAAHFTKSWVSRSLMFVSYFSIFSEKQGLSTLYPSLAVHSQVYENTGALNAIVDNDNWEQTPAQG